LCSEDVDTGAQMFSYDPASGRILHLAISRKRPVKRECMPFRRARAMSTSSSGRGNCTSQLMSATTRG
jgi:hypothetical protein